LSDARSDCVLKVDAVDGEKKPARVKYMESAGGDATGSGKLQRRQSFLYDAEDKMERGRQVNAAVRKSKCRKWGGEGPAAVVDEQKSWTRRTEGKGKGWGVGRKSTAEERSCNVKTVGVGRRDKATWGKAPNFGEPGSFS